MELGPPQPSWFILRSWVNGSYIFDGESGQMLGTVSHWIMTPALVTVPERGEIYHADSFIERRFTGKRNDVITVVDLKTLSTKAEIDIPDKAAALQERGHIALLGNDRHLVIYNLTPAQSVSIVDVVDRQFKGEISTPGCAVSLPVEQQSFLMICADGSLQLIDLDDNGAELQRSRSKPFFDANSDPVFANPIFTADGWLLISHDGLAYRVAVAKDQVEISPAVSLLTENDRQQTWRPGSEQGFTVHQGSNQLYVLMHQGGVDTHTQPGTEIWVYDLENLQRSKRVLLEVEAAGILVSQEQQPRLYVLGTDLKLRIFDGNDLRLVRIIDDLPKDPGMLQLLARHD